MAAVHAAVLARYHLTPADLLYAGMEAWVYRLGADAVLKLYSGTASAADLRRLQAFYAGLERDRVPYALPAIRQVVDEGAAVVTVEERLPGRPLSRAIAQAGARTVADLFPAYVDAVLALGRVPMPAAVDRYKLFDPHQISLCADGDWHSFLLRWLEIKLVALAPHFGRDVADFSRKLDRMRAYLRQPYTGPVALVHGDLFPGNMLVDEHSTVVAVVDFGLFTMAGDPLFDAATAWAFFDMYDELDADVRTRLLPLFLDRLGDQAQHALYRYLLFYSLVSANTYAPDCSDGHYRWCVDNLNWTEYWAACD